MKSKRSTIKTTLPMVRRPINVCGWIDGWRSRATPPVAMERVNQPHVKCSRRAWMVERVASSSGGCLLSFAFCADCASRSPGNFSMPLDVEYWPPDMLVSLRSVAGPMVLRFLKIPVNKRAVWTRRWKSFRVTRSRKAEFSMQREPGCFEVTKYLRVAIGDTTETGQDERVNIQSVTWNSTNPKGSCKVERWKGVSAPKFAVGGFEGLLTKVHSEPLTISQAHVSYQKRRCRDNIKMTIARRSNCMTVEERKPEVQKV